MRCAPVARDSVRRHEAVCDLVGDIVARFGRVRLRATGRSMLPTIWPGDVLVVTRARLPQLSIGDVVLYRRGSRLCAHRLLGLLGPAPGSAGARVITQGDGLSTEDAPVEFADLLGRVSAVERGPFLLDPRSRAGAAWRLTRAVIDGGLWGRRVVSRSLRVLRAAAARWLALHTSAPLAARGGSPAAFDGRCIPSGGVAPPSNTPGMLGRRVLPAGRLARLGATRDFHHGLLGAPASCAETERA
jgi:hypothetical protein